LPLALLQVNAVICKRRAEATRVLSTAQAKKKADPPRRADPLGLKLVARVLAGPGLPAYWSATSILVFVLFVDPISMTTAFVDEMT
jgi:hypothetical protein